MAGLFDEALTSGGWVPGSWHGMVGPSGEAGSGGGSDFFVNSDAPSRSGLPASNQLPPDFWTKQGFTGTPYITQQGESFAGLETPSDELIAWAAENGYVPAYSNGSGSAYGYGGILKNGRLVEGSQFGNRTNDDRAFIAGALGIGAASGAAAGLFGGAEGASVGGAELLGEAGGYGFTSTEAAGVATELGAAGASAGTGLTPGAGEFVADLSAGNTANSAGSFLQQIGSGVGNMGARDWVSIISGLYGMNLSREARKASDPFGPRREGYGNDLAALEANPNLIMGKPGWRAGQEIISRQMGARGYVGSGNEKGAMMRYAGDFYDRELNRLAGLAGAGTAPGNGRFNSAELAGQSLASIGYGLAPYFRGGGGGSGGSGGNVGGSSYNTGYEDPFKNVGGP